MFSNAGLRKTMRFTMFSRVSCVRKTAAFRGIYEKHDRFAKNHVFLRVFRRPVALKREFGRANPSETRVLDAQVCENHAMFSRAQSRKTKPFCFFLVGAVKKKRLEALKPPPYLLNRRWFATIHGASG